MNRTELGRLLAGAAHDSEEWRQARAERNQRLQRWDVVMGWSLVAMAACLLLLTLVTSLAR